MNPVKKKLPLDAPTPAPAEPWCRTTADRVELVKPHVWLMGNIFVRDAAGGLAQTRELEPERAHIAEGALVIEEFDMVIPLISIHIIRKEKP